MIWYDITGYGPWFMIWLARCIHHVQHKRRVLAVLHCQTHWLAFNAQFSLSFEQMNVRIFLLSLRVPRQMVCLANEQVHERRFSMMQVSNHSNISHSFRQLHQVHQKPNMNMDMSMNGNGNVSVNRNKLLRLTCSDHDSCWNEERRMKRLPVSSRHAYSLLYVVAGRSFSCSWNFLTLIGAMIGSERGCVSSSWTKASTSRP